MSEPLPDTLSTHTHFFRGEAELEAAIAHLSERASLRRPRLWCAGCSTGAEPYTLAILCAERGIDAVIHATDINTDALGIARAARYADLSLRRAPAHLRARYFDRAGGDYIVVPEIARRVTFEESDLRSGPFPFFPSPDGEPGWDVILCRNVLIYYEPEAARAIAARLATALRHDGLLIVGSTDPLAFRTAPLLRSVSIGDVASYGRAEPASPFAAAPEPVIAPPASVRFPVSAALDAAPASARFPIAGALDAAPASVRFAGAASPDGPPASVRFAAAAPPDAAPASVRFPASAALDAAPASVRFAGAASPDAPPASVRFPATASPDAAPASVRSPATPVPAVPADDLTPMLAAACGHLASHAWDEAEAALARAERSFPLAPEPHLYLGLIRRKQNRIDEATEHLRRAVFLSPQCWIASYLLAGTWERLGDRSRARLELSRTLETLSRGPAPPRPIGAEIAGLAFDPAEVAKACRGRLGR